MTSFLIISFVMMKNAVQKFHELFKNKSSPEVYENFPLSAFAVKALHEHRIYEYGFVNFFKRKTCSSSPPFLCMLTLRHKTLCMAFHLESFHFCTLKVSTALEGGRENDVIKIILESDHY